MRKSGQQKSHRLLFRTILLLIALGISVAMPQPSWTENEEKRRAAYNTKIPMRDGIHLSADIYFPSGSGPFPSILSRTP